MKTKELKLKMPKYMRKGQTIFNFLEWLAVSKGFSTNESPRMADPFDIQDEEWDKLIKEYEKLQGQF